MEPLARDAPVLPGDEQQQAWSRMMRAAQDGDAELYRRLLGEIVPFTRDLLRGRTGAVPVEDVLQDVLLTVHRVRHTYHPAHPFVPWLMAIIQLRGIDPHRRQARVAHCKPAAEALEVSVGVETHVSDIIDADDRAERPQNAVRAPPRRQRTAMELVKLSKLLTAEPAFRKGQSLGAIKIIVHRRLQALRRLLQENPR